jgi:hypothetical protein
MTEEGVFEFKSSLAVATSPVSPNPTPSNLSNQATDAVLAGSRAIDPEEFFAEVVALQVRDDDRGVPITHELYLEAYKTAGIDRAMPPPCTPAQEESLRWAKGYVLAQARRRQREEAMRSGRDDTRRIRGRAAGGSGLG